MSIPEGLDPTTIAATFLDDVRLSEPSPELFDLCAPGFLAEWVGYGPMADWLERREVAGVASHDQGKYATGHENVFYAPLFDRGTVAAWEGRPTVGIISLAFHPSRGHWVVVGMGDRMMGPDQATELVAD